MEQSCTICFEYPGIIEWHHTVPRSRGGEDSLQIPLCSTCHKAIHSNALHIVSKIRSRDKAKSSKRFWRSLEEEQRANQYLQILVEAIVRPIPSDLERKHLLSIKVSTALFEQFKLLQLDLGLSSQEKVLELCIQQMLKLRGIDNVRSTTKTKRSSKDENLWFMQRF